MPEPNEPSTQPGKICDSALDGGLAAAFRRGGDRSVLDLMGGRVSRVSLREPPSDSTSPAPILRPVPGGRAGRYQFQGEIARGGVGVVLRGHDVDLGRDVAVKVLREEHVENADVVRRFVEEAQVGGQLQHPGIVPVYELGLQADGRTPWFAMKLVKGRTLAALLAERGHSSDERPRYLGIFQQVCQTVAYAHSRGVVHRDLKPSNVMLGPFGEVQVVDWGFAKVLKQGGLDDERRAVEAGRSVIATVRSGSPDAQSMVGSVMGTLPYLPPEQASGRVEEIDERSDVFSLGAVLCEILTGLPAYAGDPSTMVVRAAKADLADAHARLDACGADREIVDAAKSCLVPAREARPRHAGALADAVAAYLSGIEARAQDAKAEATAARRTKKLAIAIGAVVATGLVVSLVAWLEADRQRGRAEKGEKDALEQKAEVEKRNTRLERVAYARRLQGLADAVEAGELRGVAWQIDELAPKQDAVELDMLRFRATLPQPEVIELSAGPVADMRFSRDGSRMAVATVGGDVEIVHAAHGARICRIAGAGHRVRWLPDGQRIVVLEETGATRLYDARTGSRLAEAQHGARALALAVSPDGATIATAGMDGTVRLARAADLAELRRFSLGATCVHDVAFDAAGARLVVAAGNLKGGECGAVVLDAASGVVLAGPLRRLHFETVVTCTSAMFGRDGKSVIAAYAGGSIFVWSIENQSVVRELESGWNWALGLDHRLEDLTPDGHFVLTTSEDHVSVLDVDAGRRVGFVSECKVTPRAFGAMRGGARVSPDGRSIVSWDVGARLRRWQWLDLALPFDLPASPECGNVSSIAFSKDGSTLLAVDNVGLVTGWNLAARTPTFEPVALGGPLTEHSILALAGDRVAVMGGDLVLHIVDSATGKRLRSLSVSPELAQTCRQRAFYPMALDASADGRRIAVAVGTHFFGYDPSFVAPVLVFDAAGEQPVRVLPAHAGIASAVAVSPDGTIIVSAGLDDRVRAWELRSGETEPRPLWERPAMSAHQLSFGRAGDDVVVTLRDGTIHRLDPRTGAPTAQDRRYDRADPYPFLSSSHVVFPSENRMVMVSGHGTVRIWDEDGVALPGAAFPVYLDRRGEDVYVARLAPDAAFAALAGTDGYVRVIPLRSRSSAARLAPSREECETFDAAVRRLEDAGLDRAAAEASVECDSSLAADVRARVLAAVRRAELGFWSYFRHSWALTFRDEFTAEQASRALQLAQIAFDRSDPGSSERAYAQLDLAWILFRAGDFVGADAKADEAERAFLDPYPHLDPDWKALRALIAAALGHAEASRAFLAESERLERLDGTAEHCCIRPWARAAVAKLPR